MQCHNSLDLNTVGFLGEWLKWRQMQYYSISALVSLSFLKIPFKVNSELLRARGSILSIFLKT